MTHEFSYSNDTLLCDRRTRLVLDDVVLDLRVDPSESGSSRGREVVAKSKEVSEDQGSKEATSLNRD